MLKKSSVGSVQFSRPTDWVVGGDPVCVLPSTGINVISFSPSLDVKSLCMLMTPSRVFRESFLALCEGRFSGDPLAV